METVAAYDLYSRALDGKMFPASYLSTNKGLEYVPLGAVHELGLTIKELTYNKMKTLTYRRYPRQFACFLSSRLSHLIQTKVNTGNVRDMYVKGITERKIPSMLTFSLLI